MKAVGIDAHDACLDVHSKPGASHRHWDCEMERGWLVMDFLCSPAAEGGDALTGKASQLDPQKFAYAAINRSPLGETIL
jgi:hypothetical protein